MKALQTLKKLHQEESGQDTVEYVLIGAAVITALVAGTPALSTVLTNSINALGAKITAAIG